MKWYNTKLDKLPKDKQEVLISSRGINYVAFYDAKLKCFLVSERTQNLEFMADNDQLYWTEYTRPGK